MAKIALNHDPERKSPFQILWREDGKRYSRFFETEQAREKFIETNSFFKARKIWLLYKMSKTKMGERFWRRMLFVLQGVEGRFKCQSKFYALNVYSGDILKNCAKSLVGKIAEGFVCASVAACVFSGAHAQDFESLPPEIQALLISNYEEQIDTDDFGALCKDNLARLKRLAERLNAKDFDTRIAALEKQLPQSDKNLYLEMRKLRRELMLKDLDFTQVLCVDAPYPTGSEAPHEGRVRVENTATFGGKLITVDIKTFAQTRLLFPEEEGSAAVGRPDLFFDASKIVFSARGKGDTNYRLYSIRSDGEGLERLTEGGYNDSDPAWLPDGNIVFCTSRSNHFLRCGGSEFRLQVLARCDADGKNIYFISSNVESDAMPYVLDDGRILYCRWEYVDKNIFRIQSLWTINPDGTNSQVFWGNQSHWPDVPICAMQIPNTSKYLFASASHHNLYRAGLGIIDPSEGLNYPDGIYNLTPQVGWAEAGPGPEDAQYNPAFSMPRTFATFFTPHPVDAHRYLVSARTGKGREIKNSAYSLEDRLGLAGSYTNRTVNEKDAYFDLYLADYDGNMELVYRGERNIKFAQPLRARKVPEVRPNVTAWQGDKPSANAKPLEGVLYSANIYANSGIPQGSAKYLRVVEHCAPTYADGVKDATKEWFAVMDYLKLDNARPFVSKDNSICKFFLSGETAMSILVDESHKRILGEAPIEADGSVNIQVPPMRAVYFQVLDKDRKVLQTMRSSTHVMSAEARGCMGCHATHASSAPPRTPAMALRKPPHRLKGRFGDATMGFKRHIQPILDKHCTSCHSEAKGHKLVLEGAKILPEWNFTKSYLNLVLGLQKGGRPSSSASYAAAIFPYEVYPNPDLKKSYEESVLPPMSLLSGKSRLISTLEKGHNGVEISDEDLDALKAWIDLNCPFYGEEDVLETPDVDAQKYFSDANRTQGLSYAPRMRTSPDVDRAYRQDKFPTQESRLPKDAEGKPQPAIRYEGSKRITVSE